MATNYNYFGNLVTNGLILDLDAAKLDSYPDSGTVWRDISGNGNNGTLTNGPAFSGVGKQANFLFDNTDDYVVISSSATITPRTGDFSSDFWINPTAWASSNYQPIQVTAITNGLWIGQNASNQFIVRAYGVADRLQYTPRPSTGSWSNVSITRNSNLINLYYNGTPVTSSISNQDFVQGTTYLGSDAPGGSGAVYFNGRIASSKYYNKGLSQFEVWQNFNAFKGRYGIPDIVTNGLVLNLDAGNPYSYLSGSSGTTWANTVAVSSSISGTLVNGPVYANGAITFDGTNDCVNISGLILPIGSGDYGVEAWVNRTTVPLNASKAIISGDSDNSFYFGFGKTFNGANGLRIGKSNIADAENCNFTFVANTWYHVAVTRTSSVVSFYVNAQQQPTSGSGTSGFSFPSSSFAKIGGSGPSSPPNPSEFFYGNISGVRTYNKGLSQAEITQNFNALRGRYGI